MFDHSFQPPSASAQQSQEELGEPMEAGQVWDLRTRFDDPAYPSRRQVKLLVGVCMALGLVGWAASSGRSFGNRTVTTGSGPHEELVQEFSFKKQCRDVEVGSDCYRDIQYAQEHIKQHPGWYVGLRPDDGLKAFQHFLHHQRMSGGKCRCPKPCDFHPKKNKREKGPNSSGKKCKDAEKGTNCYNHVTYTKNVNLPKHPEWYAGLSLKAGFFEIQSFLHEQDADVCPTPCTKPTKKKKMDKPEKKVHEKCKKLNRLKRILCEEELKEKESDKEPEDCQDALAGSKCFNDVLYAQKTLKQGLHLEWYPGLPVHANRAMVQAYLHKQDDGDGEPRCPAPCDREAVEQLDESKLKACHTATEETDKECYDSVCWVISTGIEKHPGWYPNISSADSFETVQARLAKDPKGKCAGHNPCPCETAKKGDGCWNAVKWVLSDGIDKHPSWYPGLTNQSSFEEVQERVHNDRHTKCKLPCVFAPWWEKPESSEA